MRELIVTADDFGLAIPVNDAIERAHREGILSSASLMVAAPETSDAVRRAHGLPKLRVGLHVVLVNGRPALPPERVPALVDSSGRFSSNLFAAGVNYFFNPAARRQLQAEVRAQFEAFARTGLPLDHVNAQNHFHVHPTVLATILSVGREYGIRAVRIPHEPFAPSYRAVHTRPAARWANDVLLRPWMALMRARLRKAGVASNDYVFGMNDSGHVTADRVRAFLGVMPEGVCELYVHPATQTWPGAHPADYDFAGEMHAMIDPDVVQIVRTGDIRTTSYTELANAR